MVILILFFFLLPSLAQSQNITDELNRSWIYKKSNLYVMSHPGFSPQPRITSFQNPYQHDVSIKGIMNFNFGLAYMYNFNEKFGITADFTLPLLSVKSLKVNHEINGEFISEEDKFLYVSQNRIIDQVKMPINHAMSMQIKFIHRNQISKKIDFVYSLGVGYQSHRSFIYIYNSTSLEEDETVLILSQFKFENRNNKSYDLIPTASFSLGINHLLKNKRYLNYQVSTILPFSNPYTNGSFYILPDSPYESSGTFKLMPWVVNLEINYVFTFVRRKERKGFLESSH